MARAGGSLPIGTRVEHYFPREPFGVLKFKEEGEPLLANASGLDQVLHQCCDLQGSNSFHVKWCMYIEWKVLGNRVLYISVNMRKCIKKELKVRDCFPKLLNFFLDSSARAPYKIV